MTIDEVKDLIYNKDVENHGCLINQLFYMQSFFI